jgi:protein dithiol oxidoreductase (disulfide-forming)
MPASPSLSRRLALLALCALPLSAHAQLTEGVNYTRVLPPQPVDSGNKIEVIEFFSYGCIHCKNLEPILNPWIKALPADVELRRIPVAFQQAWEGLSRVYYTLEAMGEAERLSPAVFSAIHDKSLRLDKEADFFKWASEQKLDAKRVSDTYRSFGVNSRMTRARQVAAAYKVDSTPLMVVDGRFRSSIPAGPDGPKQLMKTLDDLIVMARNERAAKK